MIMIESLGTVQSKPLKYRGDGHVCRIYKQLRHNVIVNKHGRQHWNLQ